MSRAWNDFYEVARMVMEYLQDDDCYYFSYNVDGPVTDQDILRHELILSMLDFKEIPFGVIHSIVESDHYDILSHCDSTSTLRTYIELMGPKLFHFWFAIYGIYMDTPPFKGGLFYKSTVRWRITIVNKPRIIIICE